MSVVAYHFWSPTCGPCKAIKMAVEEMKQEDFSHYTWVTVNTHEDRDNLSRGFGITMVPSLVIVTKDSNGIVKKHQSCNTSLPYTERYTGAQISEWTRLLRNASKV